MIDLKKFKENFDIFDKEVTIELIDMYLSQYQKEFITTRNSIVQKDFQNLAFAACRINGLVFYFCDPVVTELSNRLENMTRNNNKIEDGVETLFQELEVSHGLMVKELIMMKEELMKDQK